MKAQTLIFSVFWLWCYGLPAQIPPPTFEWAKSFGGWQDDYLADMAMDEDGNVYVTGSFRDYICFDSLCFNARNQDSSDVFIAKFDSLGKVIWAKAFGGRGFDHGRAIALGQNGNVFVGGNFSDTIQVDNFTLLSSDPSFWGWGAGDIFVLKINSNGDLVFVYHVGGESFDELETLTIDSIENIYIAGLFFSDSLKVNGKAILYGNAQTLSQYLIKFDSDGIIDEAKIIESSSNVRPYLSQMFVNDSGLILHGSFGDSMIIDNKIISTGQPINNYIMLLDHNGNYIWSEVFKKTQIHSLANCENGAIYFTGILRDQASFDSLTNIEGPSFYLAKYSPLGRIEWLKILSDDLPIELDLYCNNNQEYLFATFSPKVQIADTIFSTSPGLNKLLIARFDTSGNLIWVRTAGSPSNYWAIDITGNKKGSIIIGGGFNYNATFFDSISVWNSFPSFFEPFIAKLVTDSILPPPTPPPAWIIYPNPVGDQLTISGEFEPGELFFQLFDLSGRKVWKRTLAIDQEIQKTMKFPPLPSGMYILMARQGDKVEVFKLLKE